MIQTWPLIIPLLALLGGAAEAKPGKRLTLTYGLMAYPHVACEEAGCRRGHELASEASRAYARRDYLLAARKHVAAARELRSAIRRPDPEHAGELFRALCYNAGVSYLMARRAHPSWGDLRRMAATDAGCARGVREARRLGTRQ